MSAELGRYPASVLSDALDRLGIHGQVEGIKPVGPAGRLCGPAFTIAMAPASRPPGSVGDYIDDVEPGAVVVIDNRGRTDTTVWGGLLSFTASRRGLGGTVVDGVCRDSEILQEVDYPLFARATHMRTGKDRVQVAAYGGPVVLGTVRVEEGDWIVGDGDGVVVVPVDAVARVLEAAELIDRAEEAIKAAVADGLRLDEARERFGYHSLQAPGS